MYILTGGAGFIGSNILHYLNSLGVDDILLVDSLGSSEKWRNIAGARAGDYLHKDDFLKRIEGGGKLPAADAIIHMGACSSTTETDADYMLANNFRYTKTLAEWALAENIRFIYASSAATYGDGALGFSDDDGLTRQLRPLNVYAFSKQLFDIWALKTGAAAAVAGLKFFNVYGPNEYHKGGMCSMVYKAFHQIRDTGAVRLFKSDSADYADGEQQRDFVYVKDCCRVVHWLLEHPAAAGIFNLGSGQARTWNDLVNAVFAALHVKPEIEYVDMPGELRGKYQYFTRAEMDKLHTAMGEYIPTTLESGVRDYVQNYLNSDQPYL